MTKEEKNTLEEAIVADLRDPSLTYLQVAVRFGVGINRVIALSKQNGLTRPRGKKSAPKPTAEQKQQTRMSKGQCSVHGIFVSQCGNAVGGSIAECPRQDCDLLYFTPFRSRSLTPVTCEQAEQLKKEYRIHELQSMLDAEQGR